MGKSLTFVFCHETDSSGKPIHLSHPPLLYSVILLTALLKAGVSGISARDDDESNQSQIVCQCYSQLIELCLLLPSLYLAYIIRSRQPLRALLEPSNHPSIDPFPPCLRLARSLMNGCFRGRDKNKRRLVLFISTSNRTSKRIFLGETCALE